MPLSEFLMFLPFFHMHLLDLDHYSPQQSKLCHCSPWFKSSAGRLKSKYKKQDSVRQTG